LAAFDGPVPKTPYSRKNLLRKPSYSHFIPNFVAMATWERGRVCGKNGEGKGEGKWGRGEGKGRTRGRRRKRERRRGREREGGRKIA